MRECAPSGLPWRAQGRAGWVCRGGVESPRVRRLREKRCRLASVPPLDEGAVEDPGQWVDVNDALWRLIRETRVKLLPSTVAM